MATGNFVCGYVGCVSWLLAVVGEHILMNELDIRALLGIF